MNHKRILAAKMLEQVGWALIRYARRVIRAEESPSSKRDEGVLKWYREARMRIARFKHARADYLSHQEQLHAEDLPPLQTPRPEEPHMLSEQRVRHILGLLERR